MEAYLDNSATTRCTEEVRDIVVKTMMEDYGNPSAKHLKGFQAEKYVTEARNLIAATMKVSEKEIFFTSGGTESNNWALIGCAMANRRKGNHIITTAVEHPAVVQPLEFLAEQGFRITYIPVDRYGRVDPEKVAQAVEADTILVSVMYVNNEIGAVEPVEEISRRVREKNPQIIFHVDAIQAYGKYRILPKKQGIDLLSVSSHKIHGPKGVGFLYINEKVRILPLIHGGGQQKGMRSGTDNVPGIAGLGVAAQGAYRDFEKTSAHLRELKRFFMEEISGLPDVVLNSIPQGAPHIISVSFRGVRSEVLLHALEEREIYVSSGSACSSNKKLPVSEVLKEIGLDQDLLETTIRFSFCKDTTKEELEYTLKELKAILPVLRKYSRH